MHGVFTKQLLCLCRFNPQWLKMTEKNVKSGVVKSTLNDKTRYLVTAKCPKTGADSAIHTLMVQNAENPKVWFILFCVSWLYKLTRVAPNSSSMESTGRNPSLNRRPFPGSRRLFWKQRTTSRSSHSLRRVLPRRVHFSTVSGFE